MPLTRRVFTLPHSRAHHGSIFLPSPLLLRPSFPPLPGPSLPHPLTSPSPQLIECMRPKRTVPDEQVKQTLLTIHKDQASMVIGKQGQQIKHIQEVSGAQVLPHRIAGACCDTARRLRSREYCRCFAPFRLSL